MDKCINKITIEGLADLDWVDTRIDQDSFTRNLGKSEFVIFGGEKVLRKKVLPAKPFKRVCTDTEITKNFITMDIETTLDAKNQHTPHLIAAYNGDRYINSYLGEDLDQDTLFNNFLQQLITLFNKSQKVLVVYAHNLGGFDGILIMRYLGKYGKVKPLIFKGRLISIKLIMEDGENKNKFRTILFKDSYLLLPLSLRKLEKAFNLGGRVGRAAELLKGYFPFNLSNIFYQGGFPDFKYWTDISFNKFLFLKKGVKFWDFKVEAIKYCQKDCKVLHEILTKFSDLIFGEFSINIHSLRILTLPGLAMTIYKSQFMPENKIFQILGYVEQKIRESYTGAAVDVYKPSFSTQVWKGIPDSQLFYYDVNSLYPFIMAESPMPIGRPISFDGDIRKYEPDAFGGGALLLAAGAEPEPATACQLAARACEITSPKFINHPILQRKLKTKDGMRTIAGLGIWNGWIFSGEMDNAIKEGYEFKILKGYQFEKGNIFESYINRMYELRLRYNKFNPLNLIAKLLMNSLYGKFGMSIQKTDISVFYWLRPGSAKKTKRRMWKLLKNLSKVIIKIIL
jgi:DNA polymerase type B, organellar and viral